MGYSIGTVWKPDSREGQDMVWTCEIDYDEPSDHMQSHMGCIEVHAESEELMNQRVQAVLFGLGMLQPDRKK